MALDVNVLKKVLTIIGVGVSVAVTVIEAFYSLSDNNKGDSRLSNC